MHGMVNNPMMMKITELSFVIDELRLFLDTHPDCTEAMVMWNEIQRQRAAVVADFEAQFGPLGSYGTVDCGEWSRTQGYWPWQNY